MRTNGWWHATVDTIDRTTGLPHRWRLTWRSQRHECCGQVWTRWDRTTSRTPPVHGSDDWGNPMVVVSQCGTCGSMRTPHVHFHRER